MQLLQAWQKNCPFQSFSIVYSWWIHHHQHSLRICTVSDFDFSGNCLTIEMSEWDSERKNQELTIRMYGIIAHGKQWNVIYFLILFMPDQGDLPPYSCSLIVHLHLNRHPLPAFLSYLRQSERSRRLLVGSFHEKLESFRKTVIDIKQWFVINLGVTRHRSIFADVSSDSWFNLFSSVRITLRSKLIVVTLLTSQRYTVWLPSVLKR